MKIAVIGGGAAGFFAAIHASQMDNEVTLFEKTGKLLSKVLVSGGGRCNVTHACFENSRLASNYPRGERQLKGAFARFSTKDTIEWFNEKGVKLKTENDGRMFPASDNSETIADCLIREAKRRKVSIELNAEVKGLQPKLNGGFTLIANNNTLTFDKVIVTTGGSAKLEGFNWLKDLGHQISHPVPSLFTFNVPNNPITELMGTSLEQARIKVLSSKYEFSGPLLITHWGFSGPAVLKLSSYAARDLAEMGYQFSIQINWLNDKKEEAVRNELMNLKAANPTKYLRNLFPYTQLSKRLQDYLFNKANVVADKNWADVSKADIQHLVEVLLYDVYHVHGKTTFKEEFVTCGGVSLDDIQFKNMESKKIKGLHFAGEVLDIDGITGGFNFQAAWTTGYIAGVNAGK
ncbi:MAG: NAD(P)/FAD-dependent oxidoreductase [Bacteroidetes bacterium]|nr:MAG: NAD(P)/FAD-dependent oxidoreductase [Bacteroidota bacterium]